MLLTFPVGGFQRMGTSMMMKALHAGGLDVARSQERDEAMNKHAGDEHFVPNTEYYELGPKDYRSKSWPWQFEGKCFKVLQRGLANLPLGQYKTVYMMRDPVEALESYRAAFGKDTPGHHSPHDIWATMTDILARIQARPDMDVVPVWYRDVLDNPGRVFEDLWRRGWPIDPQLAAEVVNPDLERFHFHNAKVFGTEYEPREWGDPAETWECAQLMRA